MSDDSGSNIKLQFGATLRNRRLALGLSQEQFADLAGLDRTYVGGVERGKRNVSIVNIKKLADALNAPIRSLF